MKKSTLLSFLTAATVITTTAGTFAVWDKLEVTSSTSISFRNPVTVSVTNALQLEETIKLGEVSVASGDVKFEIKNYEDISSLNPELILTPEIANLETLQLIEGLQDINNASFNFEIIDKTEDEGKSLGSKSGGSEFTDETASSTDYTVKVTPANEDVAKKIAGQDISIQLTAKLQEKQQQ